MLFSLPESRRKISSDWDFEHENWYHQLVERILGSVRAGQVCAQSNRGFCAGSIPVMADSVVPGWSACRARLERADTSTAVGDRSVAQARHDFVSSRVGAPVAASTRYILQ